MEKNSIVVNSLMETSTHSFYDAGDICKYERKVKLIASGLGEAPIEICNAKIHIDPFIHSKSFSDKAGKQVEVAMK